MTSLIWQTPNNNRSTIKFTCHPKGTTKNEGYQCWLAVGFQLTRVHKISSATKGTYNVRFKTALVCEQVENSILQTKKPCTMRALSYRKNCSRERVGRVKEHQNIDWAGERMYRNEFLVLRLPLFICHCINVDLWTSEKARRYHLQKLLL